MEHFGTLLSMMKASPRVFLCSCISISLILCCSSPALSQTETSDPASAALLADIEYRKRELQRDENNSEARTQLAIALERKKDFAAAVEVLASHKDKVGRTGLVVLARNYFRLGRFNDEVTTYELANARFPKDPQLQSWLATAQSHAGRVEKSVEAFYKIKESFPKFIPGYEGLLEQLVKMDSRQEARDLLADMFKKFAAKPAWVSEQCRLFTLDSFYKPAIEWCSRAMRVDRGNPMNAVNLARTYRESGSPEKAKKVLVDAAMKIRRSEPIQTALGDYFIEKKNYIDALRWYLAAVKTDPKSFNAQMGAAMSAFELQRMEVSLKAYTAACKLDRSKTIRELQTALGKIRQRGDTKWQTQFEDAIASSCQPNL